VSACSAILAHYIGCLKESGSGALFTKSVRDAFQNGVMVFMARLGEKDFKRLSCAVGSVERSILGQLYSEYMAEYKHKGKV